METDVNPKTAPPTGSAKATNPGPDPREGATPHPSAAAAWRLALEQVGEVREYASFFLAAKIDALVLTLRKVGILAALGVLGLIAVVTIVVMMVVLFCLGTAGAFAALTGRAWLGDFIAFAIFALVLGLGAWLGLRVATGHPSKSTVEKYESRLRQQRVNFGTDVHQRAGGTDGNGA